MDTSFKGERIVEEKDTEWAARFTRKSTCRNTYDGVTHDETSATEDFLEDSERPGTTENDAVYDAEAYLASESDWVYTPTLDEELVDDSLKEESRAYPQMMEAGAGHKEPHDMLDQVRRGRGLWPVIAISAPDRKTANVTAVKGKDFSSSPSSTSQGCKKGGAIPGAATMQLFCPRLAAIDPSSGRAWD